MPCRQRGRRVEERERELAALTSRLRLCPATTGAASLGIYTLLSLATQPQRAGLLFYVFVSIANPSLTLLTTITQRDRTVVAPLLIPHLYEPETARVSLFSIFRKTPWRYYRLSNYPQRVLSSWQPYLFHAGK